MLSFVQGIMEYQAQQQGANDQKHNAAAPASATSSTVTPAGTGITLPSYPAPRLYVFDDDYLSGDSVFGKFNNPGRLFNLAALRQRLEEEKKEGKQPTHNATPRR